MASIPAAGPVPQPTDPADAGWTWRTVLRHPLPLRVMHWLNLLCMLALVGSGLQVFNAHPALYWGEASHFDTPLFAAAAERGPDGRGRGVTTLGPWRIDTTGLLGVSNRADGMRVRRGFPEWATIPGSRSLALGRRWHFFFAWLWVLNGIAYLLWSLASRHLTRDLAMRARDWRDIPRSIVAHLHLHHPVGEEALRYNPLQKLAYLGVVFVLAPLAVLTGLSMSPQMDSVLGWWLALVGGRQSARTLHFVAMTLFVLFTLVHVVMVVYAGPVNELRSMLSGRFRVRWPREPRSNGDG